MANRATILYYAKLIQKGIKTESDIPEDIKQEVLTKVATLPPLQINPVMDTHADTIVSTDPPSISE